MKSSPSFYIIIVLLGWCYFYLDPLMKQHQRSMVVFLGYEFWLWGSIILVLFCTLVYTAVVVYRKKKVYRLYTPIV